MAFIISKKTKSRGNEIRLYYLVKNYREGKKIKRITLAKLGIKKNLNEALKAIKDQVTILIQRKNEYEDRLERVKNGDTTAFIRFCPAWKQQDRMKDYIENFTNELTKFNEKELEINKLIKLYPNCSDVQNY